MQECLSNPIVDEILNFQYDYGLFEEAISSPNAATATETSPASATALPCYGHSFANTYSPYDSSDYISASFSPNSMVHRHPVDFSPCLGFEVGANGGIGGEFYGDDGMGVPNIPPAVVATTATAAETSSATRSATAYDRSFANAYSPFDDSDYISVLLHPQPPPEEEPDMLPPLPVLPMAPTYSPDSKVHQLLVDLSGCFGFGAASTLRPCPFIGANGGIGGEFYDDGMGAPPEFGYFAGAAGMAVRLTKTVETCGFGALQGVYGPGDLQVLGDGHNLMGSDGFSYGAAPLQVPSDKSSLDESNYKVGRLSVEERKEKIDRYLKKRNERNFSKKIKYACRKTLADSRPRVRGRFARNEEFSETTRRPSPYNHEYNDMMVKNEEDMLQSSDILVHISGMNSFNYNYTLESWI